MKKTKLLLAMLSVGLLAGCKPTTSSEPVVSSSQPVVSSSEVEVTSEEPVVKRYFGLGSVAYYNLTPRGTHVQTDIDYVAVVVDEAGVIEHLRLDVVQIKNELIDGLHVLESTPKGEAGDIKSKWELLDGYNMKGASPISKEWYEQAEAFENWSVGKTVTQIKAAMTDADLTDGVNIGVTVTVDLFVEALEIAIANKVEISGEVAAIGVGGKGALSVKRNSTEVNGYDWYVAAAAFDADQKVLGAAIDTFQIRYAIQPAEGEVAARAIVDTAVVQTVAAESRIKGKQELKEAYGMKGSSAIGKEWYEQAAALVEYLVGKDIATALGTESTLSNGVDIGVSIKVDGYRDTLLEAQQTAFNDRAAV